MSKDYLFDRMVEDPNFYVRVQKIKLGVRIAGVVLLLLIGWNPFDE